MPRLIEVQVTGLLGQFNHVVRFPADWEFVILHGPNGVGKTSLLELITAMFHQNVARLERMAFDTADFIFDDQTRISLSRIGRQELPFEDGDATPGASSRGVSLLFEPFGGEPVRANLEGYGNLRDLRLPPAILDELGFRRIGPERWRDVRTGEAMNFVEIWETYPELLLDRLPSRYLTRLHNPVIPEAVKAFLSSADVHLIETQRLLAKEPDEPRVAGGRDRLVDRATVTRFSRDLARKLADALAMNSRTSQQLDRTFPQRVLEGQFTPDITDEEIRARYNQQSKLRARLAQIAVLDTAPDLPLPERDLEAWERRVLWTVLNDTDEKLATFQRLLDRVNLLREIINSRFLFKELYIDQETGFRFVNANGLDLPLASLSSGEQHEIVLLYDLLFNVRENSLVLIDEPEISLHVAWQQQFLNDIASVAGVASLRFIIATHSPQIIHKWWSRAESLGGVEARDQLTAEWESEDE